MDNTDKQADPTADGSTSLITEDVVQAVIAELTIDAPSSDIKDCLKAHEYGKSFKQLTAVFTHQFSKECIVDTLSYLNVPGRAEYVKSANVESLICRIQNLLPDECGICNKVYCVKNADPSLLSCEICGQDAHNDCLISAVNNSLPQEDMRTTLSKEEVLKFFNPLNIPGWHYICKPCAADCIPQDDKGLKKKSKKENKKEENKVISPSLSLTTSEKSNPVDTNDNATPKGPLSTIVNLEGSQDNKTIDDSQTKKKTIC